MLKWLAAIYATSPTNLSRFIATRPLGSCVRSDSVRRFVLLFDDASYVSINSGKSKFIARVIAFTSNLFYLYRNTFLYVLFSFLEEMGFVPDLKSIYWYFDNLILRTGASQNGGQKGEKLIKMIKKIIDVSLRNC